MRALPLPHRHLLRKPWRLGARGPDAFDCVGIAIEARRAFGLPVVEGMFPEDYQSQDEALEQVRQQPGRWVRVGNGVYQASRVGDVVETVVADGQHHVSTLIQVEPKLFLTTNEKHGCCVVRSAQLKEHAIGVYRWTA